MLKWEMEPGDCVLIHTLSVLRSPCDCIRRLLLGKYRAPHELRLWLWREDVLHGTVLVSVSAITIVRFSHELNMGCQGRCNEGILGWYVDPVS